jgi:hypothetical protein
VDGANAAAGNANYTSSSEPASNLCGLERRL